MELTPEQQMQVREAFERGKRAEEAVKAGLPLPETLLTAVRSAHERGLVPEDREDLDNLRKIRDALTPRIRAMLAPDTTYNRRTGELIGEDVDALAARVEERLRLLELVEAGDVDSDEKDGGQHRPYARWEALEVLCAIWREAKGVESMGHGAHKNTSKKSDNYYRFNAFVTFLGTELLRVDPSLRQGRTEPRKDWESREMASDLEEACYSAWLFCDGPAYREYRPKKS